jgi:hypothetical protein
MSIKRRVTRHAHVLGRNNCLDKIGAIMHEDPKRRRIAEVE